MHKRSWVKIVAAVGLVCVLGAEWALGSSRVQDIQQVQPPLEIPLYEGAQVKWEVHLTAQEMAKGLAEWAQELSVLRIAGYTIEGERALDVLNFYDQTLSEWRRILWTRPDESGGVRLFARSPLSIILSRVRAVLQQNPSFRIIVAPASLVEKDDYLFIVVSQRYEATDLIIVTAQVIDGQLNVPIFEGAELQWELVLTKEDLLEHLKRWFVGLIENPPAAMRMRIWEQPERPRDSITEFMGWLGILWIETVSRLFQDFSELRIVGSRVYAVKFSRVLDFYDQQFSGWRRNLWIRSEESVSMRIFTRSDAQGLRELIALIVTPVGTTVINEAITDVIVLRARR